jgi:hypothetical protein
MITHWTILAVYNIPAQYGEQPRRYNIFPFLFSHSYALALAESWTRAEARMSMTTYVAIPSTNYCA